MYSIEEKILSPLIVQCTCTVIVTQKNEKYET
jgi:hypothetical protein